MKFVLGVDCGCILRGFWANTYVDGARGFLRTIHSSERFGSINVLLKKRPLTWIVPDYCLNEPGGLWDATGIPRNQLYFCRRDATKAAIAKRLRMTHFVSDRLRVLRLLHEAGIGNLYILQPTQEDMHNNPDVLDYVKIVDSWQEFAERLLASLPPIPLRT